MTPIDSCLFFISALGGAAGEPPVVADGQGSVIKDASTVLVLNGQGGVPAPAIRFGESGGSLSIKDSDFPFDLVIEGSANAELSIAGQIRIKVRANVNSLDDMPSLQYME
jgi:hypothetical protein